MKKLIEQRIEHLKDKHASIEAEIQYSQKIVQEKVAEINGVKGAIMELESLLESMAEPAPITDEPKPQ